MNQSLIHAARQARANRLALEAALKEAQALEQALASALRPQGWESAPVTSADVSARLIQAFQGGGIATLGEAVRLTAREVLALPNSGRKALREWQAYCLDHGLPCGA